MAGLTSADGTMPYIDERIPDGGGVRVWLNPGGQYESRLTPGEAQAEFEGRYHRSLMQERTVQTEGGGRKTLAAYELMFDSDSSSVRRHALTEFGMAAAQAGYGQVIGPVVVPDIARGERDQPIAAAHFIFEKPSDQSITQKTLQAEGGGPGLEEQLIATRQELEQANRSLEGYRRRARQQQRRYRQNRGSGS